MKTQWTSRTVIDTPAGAWWRCSDGEADMRDAAEYLCAVAHEN